MVSEADCRKRDAKSGGYVARSAIAKEIREGRLPQAKKLTCVDCGERAFCYDHRDYSKPLAVQPVCKSCDATRGAGKWIKGKPSHDWELRRLAYEKKGNDVRRAAKTDSNQEAVVATLRAAGATVQLLHAVGGGCPDLLISFKGRLYVAEIKDGAKSPSRRGLTPDQKRWHAAWQSPILIVTSPMDALRKIGITAYDEP